MRKQKVEKQKVENEQLRKENKQEKIMQMPKLKNYQKNQQR